MKKILGTILIGVVSATILVPNVLAAEKLQEAVTKVEESVENLVTVKDAPQEELTEAEKAAAEIKARREILNQVLALSFEEISSLEKKLNDLKNLNETEEIIKEAALKVLAGYQEYYKGITESLKPELTLDEIKTIAKNIKSWREDIYNSEVQKIVDFIIVIQGREFIAVANTRFDKITADINKLEKAGLIKVGSFDALLIEAKANLETAVLLNAAANELMLAQIKPADLEVEEEVTPSIESAAPEQSEQPETTNSVKNLIQESLDKIKVTYTLFIQISDIVKKTLKLN